MTSGSNISHVVLNKLTLININNWSIANWKLKLSIHIVFEWESIMYENIILCFIDINLKYVFYLWVYDIIMSTYYKKKQQQIEIVHPIFLFSLYLFIIFLVTLLKLIININVGYFNKFPEIFIWKQKDRYRYLIIITGLSSNCIPFFLSKYKTNLHKKEKSLKLTRMIF